MKRAAALPILLTAAAITALALSLGCSAPTSGKVTRWTWVPPTVQTVNTSCSWWSVSTSGTKYGSGKYGGTRSRTRSTNSYCVDWNTADQTSPQECTLTFTSGGNSATVPLDISEAQCKAYLGQQWPPGGSLPAGT